MLAAAGGGGWEAGEAPLCTAASCLPAHPKASTTPPHYRCCVSNPVQDQAAGPSGRPLHSGGRGGRPASGPMPAAYSTSPDGYLPPAAFYVGSPPGAYGGPPGYGMPPGIFAPGPPFYPQVGGSGGVGSVLEGGCKRSAAVVAAAAHLAARSAAAWVLLLRPLQLLLLVGCLQLLQVGSFAALLLPWLQPTGPQQHPPGYVMHPYYGMVRFAAVLSLQAAECCWPAAASCWLACMQPPACLPAWLPLRLQPSYLAPACLQMPASHPAAAGAYSAPMPSGPYGMYQPHPAGEALCEL